MRLIGWRLTGDSSLYSSKYMAEKQAAQEQTPWPVFSEEPRPEEHPFLATKEAAAVDLKATSNYYIMPGEGTTVPTGYHYDIPCHSFIRGRSGLAFKHSIVAFEGTIDKDFIEQEVKVRLFNFSGKLYVVRKGDRIAQLFPVGLPANCLFDTAGKERKGGFGHTGQ